MQGMSVDGCSWGWKRILFMWEVELVEECMVLLSNIFYMIIWKILGSTYSTKEAYDLISNFEDISDSPFI